MKVLHLVTSLGAGGRRESVRLLLSSSEESGVDGFLGCLDSPDAEPGFLAMLPCEATVFGPRTGSLSFAIVRRIRRYCEEQGIDVIHAHDGASQVYGVLACLWSRTRLVYTFRRSGGTDTKFMRDKLRNRVLSVFTDRIVVASQERRAYYARRSGVSADRIRVIYNGIQVERFLATRSERAYLRERLFSQFSWPAETLCIGSVGSLTAIKGHHRIVETFSELVDSFPDARLVIAGEGPERGRLEEQVGSLGLADRVVFVGQVADLEELYPVLDLFVLFPDTEAFGLVFVEAMASGLPVCGSRAGGIPELVLENQTGFLVEPDERGRRYEVMAACLRDPGLRTRLGEEGMKRSRDYFDIARVAREYRSLYAEVCGGSV